MKDANDSKLISPNGLLADLVVPFEEVEELRSRASSLPSLRISERSVCDLELLATGAFSPLDRFMGKADYIRVLGEMRLANDSLFPIPVTLPIEIGYPLQLDREITLCNAKNEPLAIMTVEEIYEWNWTEVAKQVYV